MSLLELSFDVVIAGGGFAGVNCAQALGKQLGASARRRVALIADQNFMVFQPMLAEVVGSSISPRHVVNAIRLLCPNVVVLRGRIVEMHLAEKCLELNGGDFTGNVQVRFQHLALSMGGIVDLSRIPGMPEHALLLKNVGDALKLRATIIDRFEEANLTEDGEAQARLLTFVVVGGGYSGVEVVGQIRDLGEAILGFYPRLRREAFQVMIIHSGQHLLPDISESLGRYCEENLRGRGVEVVLGARVASMTATRVCFAGRSVETHTVVCTIGNAPHPLIAALGQAQSVLSLNGRLLTEPTLRVQGQQNLWAAGDCAAVPKFGPTANGGAMQYCPPTAQFAQRQGTLMGQNIARVLNGEGDPQDFKFTGLGEMAAIGHHSAVAQIMGLNFSGFFAWWLWRTIYLSKLPGFERKLRVMIDWTLDLFFPRDITLFQSRPTQVLKEMCLEPGDKLFDAGEPAFSFYVLKEGKIDLLQHDGSIARTVSPGEHFGERALLSDRVCKFTAVAAERSSLVALSAEVFDTITRADHSIRELLLKTAERSAKTPQTP